MSLILSPYQAIWSSQFEEEKSKLLQNLENLDISFYHIGSTSICECMAKPIIDILGVTPDITLVNGFNVIFQKLGYQVLGEYGMPHRRYFKRAGVNLHIFEETDPDVERHLRFVDYMRKHPNKVQDYTDLKIGLAKTFPEDRDAYTLGKNNFIKEIDILAAREAQGLLYEIKKAPKKKRWSQDQIIKAIEVNRHMRMTYFAKFVPSQELIYQPDVTVVRSEGLDKSFNCIFSAQFNTENVSERIEKVIELFEQKKLPFIWKVGCIDSPANLGDLLLSKGLQRKEANSMILSLDSYTPHSSEFLIHEISSREEMDDFAKVKSSPSARELIYSQLPSIIYRDNPSFKMYVGYVEDEPVATGILILRANIAGIYAIGTRPEHRKKGFATALIHRMLGDAKEKGYSLCALQAGEECISLYEKMGFKPISNYQFYSKT